MSIEFTESLSIEEAKAQITSFMDASPSFLRELRIGAEYINHCSAGLVSVPRMLDDMNANEDEAQRWYDSMSKANHALRAAVDAFEATLVEKMREVGK
jgi:hypothetical protein